MMACDGRLARGSVPQTSSESRPAEDQEQQQPKTPTTLDDLPDESLRHILGFVGPQPDVFGCQSRCSSRILYDAVPLYRFATAVSRRWTKAAQICLYETNAMHPSGLSISEIPNDIDMCKFVTWLKSPNIKLHFLHCQFESMPGEKLQMWHQAATGILHECNTTFFMNFAVDLPWFGASDQNVSSTTALLKSIAEECPRTRWLKVRFKANPLASGERRDQMTSNETAMVAALERLISNLPSLENLTLEQRHDSLAQRMPGMTLTVRSNTLTTLRVDGLAKALLAVPHAPRLCKIYFPNHKHPQWLVPGTEHTLGDRGYTTLNTGAVHHSCHAVFQGSEEVGSLYNVPSSGHNVRLWADIIDRPRARFF